MTSLHSKQIAVVLSLITLSLILAFGPGRYLLDFAYHTGDQSYILLVPAISAALIYLDREKIFASAGEHGSKSKAIAWFVAGIALIGGAYVMTPRSELQLVFVGAGLVSFWIGAFVIAFGFATARRAFFPLALLVCILPIPSFCIDRITYVLQWASAQVTAGLFAITGVPVLRDGLFVFHLPGQSIEVAKQCSGIRSSLSLILLTMIIAHEALRGNVRRFILLAATLPIVVLKNGVRIVTLTLLAIYVDPSFLTGSLHHDGGIVFFLLGLVMLYPVLKLLQRGEMRALLDASAVSQSAMASAN
jgi:exosortase